MPFALCLAAAYTASCALCRLILFLFLEPKFAPISIRHSHLAIWTINNNLVTVICNIYLYMQFPLLTQTDGHPHLRGKCLTPGENAFSRLLLDAFHLLT